MLLGLGWLLAPDTGLDVVFLLAWDVLAVAVIGTRFLRIRRYRVVGDAEPTWLHSLLGRRSSFAATLLVSVVGMSAGGLILVANAIEVRARPIRYTVLTHSVVSFVYNTAILGIAVGVITGK